VAVICLLTASITYIIGQMTGVGVAFSRFLGVSSETGIYVGMGIVFLYAVFGGMKGITYTQVAQYIVLILAYTVPAIFISLQLTGNADPATGPGLQHGRYRCVAAEQARHGRHRPRLRQYTTTTAGSTLNMFVYTLSLMIGTAGLPHVIMRFFTVPTVKDARSSAGWALVFIAILYTTAPGRGGDGQAQPARHGQHRRRSGRRSVRAGSQHQGRRPSGLDEALGKDRSAEVRRQER
jgi:cation/acetate symporter